MPDSFWVALPVGMGLGFLTGLGVGGGSLLILWLTMALGMDPQTARGINLLFFLPAAFIASLYRWRQGTLPLPKLLPAIIAGCAGAAFCAWLSSRMDTALLKKLFGGLLVLTGLREIFYRPGKT